MFFALKLFIAFSVIMAVRFLTSLTNVVKQSLHRETLPLNKNSFLVSPQREHVPSFVPIKREFLSVRA